MRPIRYSAILSFAVLQLAAFSGALAAGWLILRFDMLVMINQIVFFLAVASLFIALNFIFYRLFVRVTDIPDGEILAGSKSEAAWQLHLLFLLFFINCFIRTRAIPVPFQRLVYLAAGANWGSNTFCSGVILDPPHVRLGSNTILGQSSIVYAHVIEGQKLELHRVTIGDDVTIGAGAIVMPGVTIGNCAIVAAGSVVRKGTQITAGEVWGGVPAKRLKPKIEDAG